MEMIVLENQPEVLMENISNKDNKVTSAASGMKLYRCVAVSFGLLCILQVALNISLRISFKVEDPTNSDSGNEARTANLTEESDELKRRLNELKFQHNALIRERDELKRRLNDLSQLFEEGWIYFRRSFFYVSSSKKSWQESREDCRRRGADLAIIDSQEEQNLLRGISKRMWIGLTDREKEGTWQWVDGTPLSISYWEPGEPNNDKNSGHEENCGEINFKDGWNDWACEKLSYWICEKRVAP